MADDARISLDPTLAARLAAAAEASGRTPEAMASEAIESFLDWDDDFRVAVDRGVAEAEAGKFATDDEIARVFRKRT